MAIESTDARERDGGPTHDSRSDSTADVISAGDDSGAIDPATAIGEKRGRGRPRKDAGSGSTAGNASPGSNAGNAREKAAPRVAVDVDALAMQLVGAHMIAAKLLKAPELMIGEQEAKVLAKAIKAMMAQYKINISPKAQAFYQLLAAASMVYGPRAISIAMRKSKETAARKQQTRPAPHNPMQAEMPGAFDPPPMQPGTMKFQ